MSSTRNIDTLRVLATVLLVSYHVIGIDETGGMQVDASSSWRFAADLLVDLRMPLFAFIAGAVYALRPLTFRRIGDFALGKARRLVVPGVIAGLFFWVLGNTLFDGSFSTGVPVIEAITLSYGHFWFLQAILILFVAVGIPDALLRYRAAVPFLFLACALYLVWNNLGIEPPALLELASAIYLAPSFLMGIIIIRHFDMLAEWSAVLASVGALVLMLGLWVNLSVYWETGRLSQDRMDLQSLLVGMGAIFLLYFAAPRVGWFDAIATMAFTMYLYHPIGTSLARRVFETLEIEAGFLRFFSGLIIGVALPVVVHVLAVRFEPTMRLLLGLRASSSSRSPFEKNRNPNAS